MGDNARHKMGLWRSILFSSACSCISCDGKNSVDNVMHGLSFHCIANDPLNHFVFSKTISLSSVEFGEKVLFISIL